MGDPVAYKYTVEPDNPDWSDHQPAFEPHESVTIEHPDDRFENMDGVKATDITPLHPE